MNIQRFTASTAREALALARATFGDQTLVLSNKQLADGVEVLAAAEAELSSFDAGTPRIVAERRPLLAGPAATSATSALAPTPAAKEVTTQEVVRADTEQLAMSTLSFQDYVRERMLRRQQAEAPKAIIARTPSTIKPTEAQPQKAVAAPPFNEMSRTTRQAVATPPMPRPLETPDIDRAPDVSNNIMNELHALKQLMEERFNILAWSAGARQNPIHSQLMLKMVRAGYSAAVARSVLEPIAAGTDAATAVRGVVATLEQMLGADANATSMPDEGGIFAIVGATGVGKTTTIAKIASQCATIHGAASVGLITLDAHRPGAHEQLRAFGRSLGIVAHLAHDRAALQELLALLSGKRMVLIDTPGIAPRDPRRRDLLDLLTIPGVKRVLVLNAGAHGDTLDEIATAFKVGGTDQAILSKVDEAAKTGPALDALIRHRLALRGIADGQRVPDDWKTADGAELVRGSMRATQRSPLDPGSADLDFYYSPAECAV